jgi:hypothetical protein
MEAAGVNFNFEVQSGNRRSSDLYDARGLATFIYGQKGNATSIVVLLNGTPALTNQLGYPSGMNYTTLLHELLHVATRMKINFLDRTSPEVKALNDLYNIVVREFNKQARAGSLPPVMEKWHRRVNNALATPDELLTWGLTDREMQAWLSNIKVGEKTLMDKLVELVREVLGISKPFETALDRLVKTSDSILDIDVKTLDGGMKSYKYSLGPSKPKTKGAPQQQSLFSKRAQELFGQKATKDVTNLPAFKRWFKGSKVVEANGKPQVVYHATNADIESFDGYEWAGWFSKDANWAAEHYTRPINERDSTGPNIVPAYLSIKNPLRIDVDMNDNVDSIKPLLR